MLILVPAIFVLAVLTSMVGRGGGNFYVPVIIAVGSGMHEAATTAQLILVVKTADKVLDSHIESDTIAYLRHSSSETRAEFTPSTSFSSLYIVSEQR